MKNQRKKYPHKCVHVWTNHWVLISPFIGIKCVTKEDAIAYVRRNAPYENLFFSVDQKTLHRFFTEGDLLHYIDWLINSHLWHEIDWCSLIHNMRDKHSAYRAQALNISQHLIKKYADKIGDYYWLNEVDKVWRSLS